MLGPCSTPAVVPIGSCSGLQPHVRAGDVVASDRAIHRREDGRVGAALAARRHGTAARGGHRCLPSWRLLIGSRAPPSKGACRFSRLQPRSQRRSGYLIRKAPSAVAGADPPSPARLLSLTEEPSQHWGHERTYLEVRPCSEADHEQALSTFRVDHTFQRASTLIGMSGSLPRRGCGTSERAFLQFHPLTDTGQRR